MAMILSLVNTPCLKPIPSALNLYHISEPTDMQRFHLKQRRVIPPRNLSTTWRCTDAIPTQRCTSARYNTQHVRWPSRHCLCARSCAKTWRHRARMHITQVREMHGQRIARIYPARTASVLTEVSLVLFPWFWDIHQVGLHV